MTAPSILKPAGPPLATKSLSRQTTAASSPQLRRAGSGSSGADSRPRTAPESSEKDESQPGSPADAPTGGQERTRRSPTLFLTDEIVRPSDTDSNASSTSRQNSGRFSPDEIRCLRRIPRPSVECEAKLENYFQTTGKLRAKLSADCWHSLPVLKGKFFQGRTLKNGSPSRSGKRREKSKETGHPSSGQPLPDESLNASVIDVIYPRTPPALAASARDELLMSTAESEPGQEDDGRATSGVRSPSPQVFHTAVAGTASALLAQSAIPADLAALQQQAPASPVHVGRASSQSRHSTVIGHSGSFCKTSSSNPRTSTSPPGGRARAAGSGPGTLLAFRGWLRENFPTLEDAYASFTKEIPNSKHITKKEWRRILSKHYLESSPTSESWERDKKDYDHIFEQLDFRGTGVITMNEFVIAVEAASPVRTIEDLRRRWLASGFASMNQAIRKMDDNGTTTTTRLQFEEFSRALSSVNVCDHGEQVALFGLICSDPGGSTSVGELASAVAMVSPALLLEDLRDRLLRKYNNNLDKAFFDFDMNRCGRINRQEFTLKAVRSLGFTDVEAKKAFREIDFNSSGEVSRIEFLGALGISEPSHLLEVLRLKVRHRYRSIKNAFARAFEESTTDDLGSQPKLSLQRVKDMLQPLDFSDQEIRLLFILMDRDQSGDLSVFEFVKAVRQFAPSCALEDLRAICCHRYRQVREAFLNPTEDRHRLIDIDTFTRVLKDLGLLDTNVAALEGNSGIRVSEVFCMIDVRHEGKASIGRLVAALQSCSSSSSVGLPLEELDLRAKQDVRGDMAPVHRLIHTLKDQVRQGKHWLDDRARQAWWENTYDVESFHDFPETVKLCVRWGMLEMKQKSEHSRRQRPKAWAEDTSPRKCRSETSLSASSTMSPGHSTSVSPGVPGGAGGGGGGGGGGGEAASGGGADGEGRGDGEEDLGATGESSLDNMPFIKTKLLRLSSKKDAAHIPRITSRNSDIRKPSTKAVPSAQQAWGTVWKSLHTSPGAQQRVKLERQIQNYFQTATSSLARDAPLLQGDCFSRTALHTHSVSRREAMRPSRSRSSP